jgi:hypothetical protein
MKYKYILCGFILVVTIMGCTAGIEEKGISDVYIMGTEQVDSCTYKYTIAFSDFSEHQRYNFWVGLMKPYYGSATNYIVAHSESFCLDLPVDGYTKEVYLKYDDGAPSDEELFGIAVKTNGAAGDLSSSDIISKGVSRNSIFAPGFPASCCPFQLVMASSNGLVQPGECTYIDESINMPELAIHVPSGDIDPTSLLNWILIITYTRSGRNDIDTISASSKLASNSWNINNAFGSKVRGGQAVVRCYSYELNCTQTFPFSIRAYNPDTSTVINYIEEIAGALWYYKYVAKHESGYQKGRSYLQFNEVGNEYEDISPDCSPAGIMYTPNAAGNGFGIFMLDNFGYEGRAPNAQELWSWKANVSSGTWWLTELQNAANSYMSDERAAAYTWFLGHYYMPEDTAGNVIFKDSTDRVIEHAVAMKRYNGASGSGNGQYCQWNDQVKIWQFNKFNNSGLNYVASVCALVVNE